MRCGGVCVIVGLAIWMAGPAAHAATALCAEMLVGDTSDAATEIDARRLALRSWTDNAGQIGIEFTRWQLAWNRRLTCTPLSNGTVRCTARGHPCRISQGPPPPGSRPLKPGDREE